MKRCLLSIFSLLLSIAPAMALEEFEHEIESTVFVPKGVWVGGVSVSY